MKISYIITSLPLISGLGCFIAYGIIGASVATDGTLIESFALIPIGWILILIGIFLSLIIYLRSISIKI